MSKLWFMGEALIDFLPICSDGRTALVPARGGSPCNANKAAAGATVGFLGALSNDIFGKQPAADLTAYGIDSAQAHRIADPATLAFVDLTEGEPRFAFLNAQSAVRQMTPDPAGFDTDAGDFAAFGPVSLVDTPGAYNIVGFALAMPVTVTLALDPSARPAMTRDMAAWRARIMAVSKRAGIVRLSAKELKALAPDTSAEAFATAQFRHSPGLVIVTHGAQGAETFTPAGHVGCPGR